MGFCTNCGAQVTGAFCQQCGRPAQGQPAPASPPTPQPLAAAPPAGRRTSPIVWVLRVLVGIVVLGGIAVVGTGLFVARKIQQAGPAVTAGKLLAALNPDLEVIDADERSGVITVREKSTGKEITLSRGKIRERRESETSLMPENYAELIPPQELKHLLAYLLAKDAKPNTP